jgi:hypothetical protein
VQVNVYAPHELQAVPLTPYPEAQVTLLTAVNAVTDPVALTVQEPAVLAPQETQLGVPDAGVRRPYPAIHPVAVRLVVVEIVHVATPVPHGRHAETPPLVNKK